MTIHFRHFRALSMSLAATLVGIAEYYSAYHGGEGHIGAAKMAAVL